MHINVLFAEALSQMPNYVKFLKDLLTNKRKFEEVSIVILTEGSLMILQKKMQKKKKNPGSFTMHCIFGDLVNEKALEN